MAYDESFYKLYSNYLEEKIVRRNHDLVFKYFQNFAQNSDFSVIDLGCGLGEYSAYGHYVFYAGVDLNSAGRVNNFIKADYHDLKFIQDLSFKPRIFVSLFSIECCHSVKDKYAFYEKIFAEIPSIEFGLVSGFFYESKRQLETVGETGDIVSHQTIEDPSVHISNLFSELRIYLKTPSKMFSEDVIEVWKILSRY